MIATIYRSDDTEFLERIVLGFRAGVPVNKDGQRVGTVLKVWREGKYIKADIECVDEDFKESTGFRINFTER